MAQDIPVFRVTVPKGTPVATPQVSNLSMPARRVDRIQVRVPPGPRGEVGFKLGSAGTAVIPADGVTFLVTDDEVIDWPLEGFWDSGSWQLTLYNTGMFPHTLEVRFLTSLPQSIPQSTGPLALPPSTPLQQPSALPPLPQLPPLPGPPSLLPLPGPPGAPVPAPQLAVSENDAMRYTESTRPDGTKDRYVLLSDGSVLHETEAADTTPGTLDSPPGSWIALLPAFFWQGTVVLRGIGSDRAVWQTTYKPGVDTAWQGPVKVLG